MNQLATSLNFSDFSKQISGGGSVSISGNVCTVSAESGQTAYVSKNFLSLPGQANEGKILARLVSGTKGQIRITNAGGNVNYKSITSNDWQEYEIGVSEKFASSGGACQFGVGFYSGDSGVMEIALPNVSYEQSSNGSTRTIAICAIKFLSNSALLDDAFFNVGVSTVEFASNELFISVQPLPSSIKAFAFVQCGYSEVNPSAQAKVKSYNAATGELKVCFVDLTGTVINPSADESLTVFAKLEI